MSGLDDFISSPDPIIANAAAQAEAYQQQYRAGQLSQADYQELCSNLLDLQQIDTSACTVEELAALQQAFNAMQTILGVASSVI